MTIDERVQALGLTLSDAFRSPTGAAYPFSWVRTRGDGHLPLNADGTLAEPRGKVGETLSIDQGAAAARLVGLAMLGSLTRELGELERIRAWLRVLGMVNVARGTTQLAGVVNGFSELIVEVFGRERGAMRDRPWGWRSCRSASRSRSRQRSRSSHGRPPRRGRRTSGCTGAGAADHVGFDQCRCAGPVNLVLYRPGGDACGNDREVLERVEADADERATRTVVTT